MGPPGVSVRIVSRLRATLRSLTNRNYRLFITGQSISVTGTWMQKIGQAWLVLELTGSGTLLGVTAALQHLPILLIGAWGGLLADRVDKRRILLCTQMLAAVLAVALGILTTTGVVEIWMVLVFALMLGTVEALDKPARHSFVLEMVGEENIVNALSLTSVVQNAGKVIGPAVGAALIVTIGLGPTFLLNGVSYLAVAGGLLLMNRDQLLSAAPLGRARGQVRESLYYVLRSPDLLGALVLTTVSGTLAYEWTVTLPLLARETFRGGADTLAVMFSAMGAGAILGGLLVAGSLRASRSTVITTAWILSLLIIAASLAPTLPLAIVVLLCVGGASVAFRATAMSLVQLLAAPEMRGRVMALLVVSIGGMRPVGAPLVGWIGETFGPRYALAVGGVATALAAVTLLAAGRRRAKAG